MNAFKLSGPAKIALWRLSEDDVRFNELEEDVRNELIHHRFVTLKPGDDDYKINQSGLDAVGSPFAIKYPMTPNNTARGYNNTLLSMSEEAKNAFISALSTVASAWFDGSIYARNIGHFIQTLINIDFWKRVPREVLESLYSAIKTEIKYHYNRDTIPNKLSFYMMELMATEALIESEICSILEKYEGIIIQEPLPLSSVPNHKIIGIDKGEIVIQTPDGDRKVSVHSTELTVYDRYRLLKALG